MYRLSRCAYNVLVSEIFLYESRIIFPEAKTRVLFQRVVLPFTRFDVARSVICTGTRVYAVIVSKKNSRPSPTHIPWHACASLRDDTRVYRYLAHIGHVRVVSQAGCKVLVSAIYQ